MLLFFLSMIFKIIIYHSSFLLFRQLMSHNDVFRMSSGVLHGGA